MPLARDLEASGRRDRRRRSCVDSADGLGAGYPSEVDVANTPRSACWPHEKRKRRLFVDQARPSQTVRSNDAPHAPLARRSTPHRILAKCLFAGLSSGRSRTRTWDLFLIREAL